MGSTCAEGHMSCSLDMVASRAQTYEELVELLAYVALCSLQAVVFAQGGRSAVRPRVARAVDARIEEVL